MKIYILPLIELKSDLDFLEMRRRETGEEGEGVEERRKGKKEGNRTKF